MKVQRIRFEFNSESELISFIKEKANDNKGFFMEIETMEDVELYTKEFNPDIEYIILNK